jgi:pimeloyl-ACP methyl ester carboxylesterase
MTQAPHDADLVLVPGLNNTHAVFDGVVAALPPAIHAHALDNPALDTVEAIAAAHLAALPARFWLAGFSFGGYVALAMLALAPERIARRWPTARPPRKSASPRWRPWPRAATSSWWPRARRPPSTPTA